MRHWCLSLWMGGSKIQTADQTPPIHRDKHQCRTDTVISSWWWAYGCPKHVEKWNKYIERNCAPSWIYLQDYTGMDGQQNIKKKKTKFTLYPLLLPPQPAAHCSLQHVLPKCSNSIFLPSSCHYILLQFSRHRRPVSYLWNCLCVFYNRYSGMRTPLSAGSSYFNL